METWSLHWLEADGSLAEWRERIEREISTARAAITRLVAVPPIDILIERRSGCVIPETGMTGLAYRSGCFSLTVDPDNANFAAAVADGAIQRTVTHEVNHCHCLRMRGPGYGLTLGEALVSEGLAGHFTQLVLGSAPEPEERALGPDELRRYFPSPAELASAEYLHDAWFYGVGGRYPRWLGYSLGYALVGQWLARTSPGARELISTPAAEILAGADPQFC